MKTLTQHIEEKLKVNKNYQNIYADAPSCNYDLRQILENRFTKFGGGTKNNPVNLNDIDVSDIVDFSHVFKYIDFNYIDVSEWNTSQAVQMDEMFSHCRELQELDLSNWNVENVKSMKEMFKSCTNIYEIILKTNKHKWNTAILNDASNMFDSCHKLRSIPGIEDFDVTNLKTANGMFKHCIKLTYLNLDAWQIKYDNVKTAPEMFDACYTSIIPVWYEG